ncbi:hypothetical protein H4219_003800 [Mycoemilia scoparia]|uniref:Peptidase M3A/M3B catalytic domain-containing protein n=1 Tax=Mycoemilia scoparia TaxID=417184 RepID=A0A9W8DSE2_9FUNG|nr:hypothetical protein H4219_003800 [Mycoemilia scoparia]
MQELSHGQDYIETKQFDWDEIASTSFEDLKSPEEVLGYLSKICQHAEALYEKMIMIPVEKQNMENYFKPFVTAKSLISDIGNLISVYENSCGDGGDLLEFVYSLRDVVDHFAKKEPNIFEFVMAYEHRDLGDDKELIAVFRHFFDQYERSGNVTSFYAKLEQESGQGYTPNTRILPQLIEYTVKANEQQQMLYHALYPRLQGGFISSSAISGSSGGNGEHICTSLENMSKSDLKRFVHKCSVTLQSFAENRNGRVKCISNNSSAIYTTSHREVYKDHHVISTMLNQFHEGLSRFYHELKSECKEKVQQFQPLASDEFKERLQKMREAYVAKANDSSEYITADQVINLCNMVFENTNYKVTYEEPGEHDGEEEEDNDSFSFINNHPTVYFNDKNSGELLGEIVLDLLERQGKKPEITCVPVRITREIALGPEGGVVRCHPIVIVRASFPSIKENYLHITHQDAFWLAGTYGVALATILSDSKYSLTSGPQTLTDLNLVPKHMFEAIILNKDVMTRGFKNPETSEHMPESLASDLVKGLQIDIAKELRINTPFCIIGLELHGSRLGSQVPLLDERISKLLPDFYDLSVNEIAGLFSNLYNDQQNLLYQEVIQRVIGYSLTQAYLPHIFEDDFSMNALICKDILSLSKKTVCSSEDDNDDDNNDKGSVILDKLKDIIGTVPKVKYALNTLGIQ